MALLVADAVEKIRVNPGNFADGRKTFDEVLYETDEEYFAERDYIEETFKPLVHPPPLPPGTPPPSSSQPCS